MSQLVLPGVALELLDEAVIVRVATVLPDGAPHAAPFWFHFDGARIVLDTLDNRTTRNIRRDGRVSVAVDAGARFEDLRQATIACEGRVFSPVEAPEQVAACLGEIRRKHASETSSPVFEAYAMRETRPQVYVELNPVSARLWRGTRS